MASVALICNLALSHIGIEKEIANLTTEKSPEASTCRRYYDSTRDEVLRDFRWPFATKILALGLLEEDPNSKWAFSYRYPTDCLLAREILSGVMPNTRQSRVPYQIGQDDSGKLIFTNQANAELEYTVMCNDPQIYPPDFVMAFSLRLASYIAPRLTGGDPFKMAERSFQLFNLSKTKAQANASNEEQPQEDPQSEFERARE